jgi:hypothetical protein
LKRGSAIARSAFTTASPSSGEPSCRAALQSKVLAWRSMSTTRACPPSRCAAVARSIARVVFPLPPFCWSTATVSIGVLLSMGTRVRKFFGTEVAREVHREVVSERIGANHQE